eukprot:scaffold124787_cov33-Tisochrysis_lutea.AAC.2
MPLDARLRDGSVIYDGLGLGGRGSRSDARRPEPKSSRDGPPARADASRGDNVDELRSAQTSFALTLTADGR